MQLDDLKEVYNKIYELTRKVCSKNKFCGGKGNCCNAVICQECVRAFDGEVLPPLNDEGTYLGENGCILKPHQRPLCTVHQCEIASMGIFKGNPEMTDLYFTLRDEAGKLEFEYESANSSVGKPDSD